MSATSLNIFTKYQDLISLDLSYTTTRKDIEDYRNWVISNFD